VKFSQDHPANCLYNMSTLGSCLFSESWLKLACMNVQDVIVTCRLYIVEYNLMNRLHVHVYICFHSVAKDYVRLMKYGDSLYRCKQLKRAALGRYVQTTCTCAYWLYWSLLILYVDIPCYFTVSQTLVFGRLICTCTYMYTLKTLNWRNTVSKDLHIYM